MDNSDIRARTRRPMFEPTVKRLQELGVRAEIVQGSLPQGRDDVMGLVAGSAGFDWPSSKSRILPGAICEHLTSFGGVMLENAGQTPLTEFLRHGAALSSGTVTEPYAIAAKFPLPFLHVYYAQGCSAAEAFYQSLSGPYQLLIVGDPLCAPWASRPIGKAAGTGVAAERHCRVPAVGRSPGGQIHRAVRLVRRRRAACGVPRRRKAAIGFDEAPRRPARIPPRRGRRRRDPDPRPRHLVRHRR